MPRGQHKVPITNGAYRGDAAERALFAAGLAPRCSRACAGRAFSSRLSKFTATDDRKIVKLAPDAARIGFPANLLLRVAHLGQFRRRGVHLDLEALGLGLTARSPLLLVGNDVR